MRRFLLTGTSLLIALIAAGCASAAPTTTTAAPPTTTASTEPAQTPQATEAGPTGAPNVGAQQFQIVAEESQARFEIGEILAGQDNLVVGVTDQVEGSFQLDLDAPNQVAFQPIRIDAARFVTDSSRRDRAIQRFILEAAAPGSEFIVFEPTQFEGLPQRAEVGAVYEISILGDLTIHDVTQSATFSGQVNVVSEQHIEGQFSTEVRWSDFGISIPQVPRVAGVDEVVLLAFDFVARAPAG